MSSRGSCAKKLRFVLSLMFVLALFTPATAQGLLGASLPVFPSSGDYRPSGCGETPRHFLKAPVFYVGWTGDRNGTNYELSSGEFRLRHRFPLRGIWLGLGETIALSDKVDAVLSAWTLVQGKDNPMAELDDDTPYQWEKTPTNWYFLDGLLATKSCGGFAALGGFRYEYFTSHFRSLEPPVSSDSGDVKINSYIPLLGVQWNYVGTDTRLLFRTVGFPRQFGSFNLVELFSGTAQEWKGDYKSGYFLEVFSEYSRRVGSMTFGVFARWNLTHATADANLNLASSNSDLGFRRTTWTLGGSCSLEFSTPF